MKTSISFISLFLIIPFILFSCGGDDSSPAETKPVVEQTLDGDYKGTWNSTTPTVTFTDFQISAKLLFANVEKTRLVGQFFATSNFTSCCDSGANDGTLTIDIENSTITSFLFNDVITDCTGSFTGSGIIDASNNLIIDFTGTDCDGDHIGQIIFRK